MQCLLLQIGGLPLQPVHLQDLQLLNGPPSRRRRDGSS